MKNRKLTWSLRFTPRTLVRVAVAFHRWDCKTRWFASHDVLRSARSTCEGLNEIYVTCGSARPVSGHEQSNWSMGPDLGCER
jgi:hypothetical protein